jgi:hypothetical protein
MDAVMADGGTPVTPPGSPVSGLPGPVGLDTGSLATNAPITYTGWPRSITWDEFTPRDSRPRGVQEDAEIKCASSPRWDWSCDGGTCRITSLTVEARVNTDESWVVNGRKSDPLLHHEQGHYDIFGLMTRELNQALVNLRARSGAALQTQIARVRQDYQARIDRLMIQYDNETAHGTDSAGQRRWDDRISESIRNGANFTAPPAP